MLSCPVSPALAAPMAIPCGEIILPIPAPQVLEATSQEGSAPIAVAVSACIGPKRTQVEVPLPVTNPPRVPIKGEIRGKYFPVTVTRNAAISGVIPA